MFAKQDIAVDCKDCFIRVIFSFKSKGVFVSLQGSIVDLTSILLTGCNAVVCASNKVGDSILSEQGSVGCGL